MLKIGIEPEIVERFKALFEEEDNDEALFRIKEVKVGGGWKSHLELRVSLDEAEDPDEEVYIKVEGLPFVVSNDVIDSYGETFEIYTDKEHNIPGVRALNWFPSQ